MHLYLRDAVAAAVERDNLRALAHLQERIVEIPDRQARLVVLDTKNPTHAHWDYAYSMTVFAAQGKTVDRTHLLVTQGSGRAMGERSFYVGITRPRNDLKVYTDSTSKAT